MDCVPTKDRDTIIDIDSKEVETPVPSDELVEGEISVTLSTNLKNIDEVSPELGKNSKRDKRKSTGAKKPPKPPQPLRGLSLDAADQKLIKEISELAMIKRARIERMKALKKMKVAKASSVSASSIGNLIAMVFTVIFCVVIIFQGCHSMGTSPGSRLATPIPGPLESNGLVDGNILVVHDHQILSTGGVPLTSVDSPSLTETVPGSDNG